MLYFFVDLLQGKKKKVPLGTTRDHLRNAMPMVVHFSGFAFCINDEEDAHELPLATCDVCFVGAEKLFHRIQQNPEEHL